jgi:ABC-type transport system substrate-binding protein
MEPVTLFAVGASLNPKINNAGYVNDDKYKALVASAQVEPDAAKRKAIYSQLNDYVLDQAFGLPIAKSTSRVITKSSVKGLEFRRNDVMGLTNVYLA